MYNTPRATVATYERDRLTQQPSTSDAAGIVLQEVRSRNAEYCRRYRAKKNEEQLAELRGITSMDPNIAAPSTSTANSAAETVIPQQNTLTRQPATNDVAQTKLQDAKKINEISFERVSFIIILFRFFLQSIITGIAITIKKDVITSRICTVVDRTCLYFFLNFRSTCSS
jgi:hypothetical protein